MTVLNLYQRDDKQGLRTARNANSTDNGLRFAKFFGNPGTGSGGTSNALFAWLCVPVKGILPTLANVGNPALLTDACCRLGKLAPQHKDFLLKSRLLTGVGLPHPSDNGFEFHPTLGVPYLRGTALKQVARAGAEFLGACEAKIDLILGKHEHKAGKVSFLDGLPTAPITLVTEQITPHYDPYYGGPNPALGGQRDDCNRPADWHDPIPISLLAVEAGAHFRIGVRALNPVHSAKAMKWLTTGLDEFGFGAKTSLGFGWLVQKDRPMVGSKYVYDTLRVEVVEIALDGNLIMRDIDDPGSSLIEAPYDKKEMILRQ